MNFVVDGFKADDRENFLTLLDMADPWARENGRDDIPESNWQSLLSDSTALQGFALRDEETARLVGYVLYYYAPSIKTRLDKCYICDLFVHPDSRRQGGGTLLMDTVKNDATEKQSGCMCWVANPNRDESIGFFSKLEAEHLPHHLFVQWLEDKVA